MPGKERYRDTKKWVFVLVGFLFLSLLFQLGPQTLEHRFPKFIAHLLPLVNPLEVALTVT